MIINNMMSQEKVQLAFRASGMRLTQPRQKIIDFMDHNQSHPTARQVFDNLKSKCPSLSLATVYNTLEVLVEHGLVHNLGAAFDDEVHYDGEITPHINLICTRCHAIKDLPVGMLQDISKQVNEKTGFKITGSRIVYYGRCDACQTKI